MRRVGGGSKELRAKGRESIRLPTRFCPLAAEPNHFIRRWRQVAARECEAGRVVAMTHCVAARCASKRSARALARAPTAAARSRTCTWPHCLKRPAPHYNSNRANEKERIIRGPQIILAARRWPLHASQCNILIEARAARQLQAREQRRASGRASYTCRRWRRKPVDFVCRLAAPRRQLAALASQMKGAAVLWQRRRDN